MPLFGADFDGITDLNPSLRLVSGKLALAQAILRRLQTPRGGLFYDDSYGYDLRGCLNDGILSVGAIAAAVQQQCELDERVSRADCSARLSPRTGRLIVRVSLQTALGPMQLTLAASKLTVELLNQ